MTAIENPQLDFSEKKSLVSKYKFTKLVQQSGGTAFTITTGANTETIFELPPRVFNMSRSVLKLRAIPTTHATLTAWPFQDCVAPFRQVQLYTRSGVYLCDVNNVDKYTAIVLKSDINTEDAEVQDIGDNDDSTFCTFGAVSGGSDINYAYDGVVMGHGIVNANTATGNYYEPQYLRQAYGTIATDNAPIMNLSIPLSLFKNTLLALDKPFYFNEPLMLKITWNTSVSWGVGSTSITAPHTGAAALNTPIEVTNMYLHLALEQNPVIAAGVVSSVVSKGLNVIVPYVYGFVNVGTTSTAQTVSIRVNRANGMKLKKIYHGIFNATATGATRYNHRNVEGAICQSYWTAVNNNRLQETDVAISASAHDDFTILREVLPNSIAASSLATYRRNWFIIDKFDENLVDEKNGIVNDGLDLSTEIKWDCNGTVTGVVHNYYTFAVVSRVLMITPQGIMIQ